VDTDLFRPAGAGERNLLRQEAGLPATPAIVVGFVGRFVEEKGIRDLVAAGDLAVRRVPGLSVALLGDGPLRGEVEAAARARPWLTIHPRRDQRGVASFMRALDGFVLPSRSTPRWEEQFGLVLSEAMACGLPVIGSSSGAIPEVVGDAGWVYREADVTSLARLLAAAGDRTAMAGHSRSARRRALEQYSSQAVGGSISATIREAVQACAARNGELHASS
jgi:glycosyltransferase involved in cell wall biosynthesis